MDNVSSNISHKGAVILACITSWPVNQGEETIFLTLINPGVKFLKYYFTCSTVLVPWKMYLSLWNLNLPFQSRQGENDKQDKKSFCFGQNSKMFLLFWLFGSKTHLIHWPVYDLIFLTAWKQEIYRKSIVTPLHLPKLRDKNNS